MVMKEMKVKESKKEREFPHLKREEKTAVPGLMPSGLFQAQEMNGKKMQKIQ